MNITAMSVENMYIFLDNTLVECERALSCNIYVFLLLTIKYWKTCLNLLLPLACPCLLFLELVNNVIIVCSM